MLEKFRERRNEEAGFTLVELLVVMLILGILAAIAVPAFFSQRDKARDADAKSSVRTAQTAMEAYATDNGGSYAGVAADGAELKAIEQTLNNATLTVSSTADTYNLTATSDVAGQTFSINRSGTGTTTFPCTVPGEGGCPSGTAGWGG